MNTQTKIGEEYKDGVSITALAKKYELSNRKIKTILINNKVVLRSRAEQNIITNQNRTKAVNDNYFSIIDKPEKAWLLGFLASDGSVDRRRNRIKIGLSSIDVHILESIKEELSIEREIYSTITNKGYAVSELTWSSKQMKKDLSKFGIIPNKTYTDTLSMELIPEQYKLSYILGYFDGDGCLRKDGRFEICSYTSSLLEEISDYLNRLLDNSTVKPYSSPNRSKYFTITYSYVPTRILLSKMYDNGSSLFLKRKHLIFQNIIKPRDYDNH